MVDAIEPDDGFPMDMDDEAALYQARCVFLGKHPKNYDFYLEPGPASLRVIRCRRGDRYLPTPAALEGAYTDTTVAIRAVVTYIGNIGKAKPLPINGIMQQPGVKDEFELAVERDGDFVDAAAEGLPVPPPVFDLTAAGVPAPDDVEESITVRTRRAKQIAAKTK